MTTTTDLRERAEKFLRDAAGARRETFATDSKEGRIADRLNTSYLNALDLIRALLAQSAAPVGVEGWRPIETAPKGVKIIAGYRNELGNWRTILAAYYPTGTLPASDYSDTDDEWATEGWYEEGEASAYCENLQLTERIPTHWKPLATPPAAAPAQDAATEGEPETQTDPLVKPICGCPFEEFTYRGFTIQVHADPGAPISACIYDTDAVHELSAKTMDEARAEACALIDVDLRAAPDAREGLAKRLERLKWDDVGRELFPDGKGGFERVSDLASDLLAALPAVPEVRGDMSAIIRFQERP